MISDTVRGFASGRSYKSYINTNQLFEDGNDKNDNIIYLDLSKAFNTVPDERLLRQSLAH